MSRNTDVSDILAIKAEMAKRCAGNGMNCGVAPVHSILGIPLCADHTEALRAALTPERSEASAAELSIPRQAKAPLIDPSRSVVYYISRTGTPGIKIGVLQNVHKRMKQLGGRIHLLAVEPGGYAVERKRHHQFRTLRNPGTEWFQQTDGLMQHIDNLVFRYGQPRCNCPANSGRRCPAGM